jgi:hypothetical protein
MLFGKKLPFAAGEVPTCARDDPRQDFEARTKHSKVIKNINIMVGLSWSFLLHKLVGSEGFLLEALENSVIHLPVENTLHSRLARLWERLPRAPQPKLTFVRKSPNSYRKGDRQPPASAATPARI